ncbi:MAG: NADH-quinone oxidoreductase subunit M [Gemmatimonadota bacterium]|nr:NADH-quinone oxidoreductase subunit M [Gemmatimonadota bacterium]
MMTAFLDSIGYGQWILHALIVIPLAGMIAIALGSAAAAKRTALVVTTIEFILSIGLWWAVDTAPGTLQLVSSTPWIPGWGIHYRLGIDGISLFMVLLTTMLLPLCVLSSWTYIAKQEKGYYALLLALTTGVIGVFLALDLFVFYVFWELMLIPMYFLIGIWGGGNRHYAAFKFFLYTMAGSLLMLVAIIYTAWWVRVQTGVWSFAYEHLQGQSLAISTVAVLPFMAFALAFAIKVPIFPFHTWLPDAHVEAPTAGSVLLAAVLLKMGTYGFLRFANPIFPYAAMSWGVSYTMIGLGVIGVVYGALVAMVQPDVKKLVAYSSVSHLGFVILGLWAGTVQGVQGALMVMIGHGLSTGALFFLIGMLYERRHTREISAFGGIARVMPLFSAAFVITALASIGLPGLSGFVGEFLVLIGTFARYPWATAVATTGVIFAAAYLLWALQRMLFEKLDKPENEKLLDLNLREVVVLLPLLLGMIWLGLYPKPVLDKMEPASRKYIEHLRIAEPVAGNTAIRATAGGPQ